MSVPEDERFRNILEEDNHEHHIVKVSQDDYGKFTMRKFGSFTRVTDNFCFETEDLKNQTMCYLTITGDSGEEKPECKHGISTTTAVIQADGMCPHEDEALDSFVLCESKILDFRKEHQENIKILDSNKKRYHKLNRTSKYKMIIKQMDDDDDDGSSFDFLDLCKHNGEHHLGNYPRNIKEKNCKNNLKVSLRLMQKDNTEWDQKLSLDRSIKSCLHENDCQFLNQQQELCEGPSAVRGQETLSGSNFMFFGDVGTIGPVGGQNHKFKYVRDQSRRVVEDSQTRGRAKSRIPIKTK